MTKKNKCIVLTFSEVKNLLKGLEKDGAGIWELEELSKTQLRISKRID